MKKATIFLLIAATFLFSACDQGEMTLPNDKHMKKSIIPLLGAAILLAACENMPHEVKTLTLTSEERVINSQQNEFSLDLLKQVCANEKSSENVFLSPLGVAFVCGMMTNGAEGNTLDQILTTIGAEDYSVDDLNEYYKNILENLPYLDKTTDMKIADAIWVDNQCHAKKDFIGINKMYYLADVVNLDLQDQLAPKAINDWANKNTKGLIKEVINGPFSDDVRMVLTNAIYFKGQWAKEFKKVNTREEEFTLASGTTATVSMMNMEKELSVTPPYDWQLYFSQIDTVPDYYDARMLRLYFKDKAYCMDIVLPREGINCEDYLAEFDMEQLKELEELLRSYNVEVKLPKFTLKYHRDLNEDMQTLGMTDAFNGQLADFSGIAEEDLYLNKLFQDSFLEVDEEGAKAAAVTTSFFTNAAAPDRAVEPFIVNRPFLLFIRECKYGTILFAGKIGHPETK